MTLQLSARSTMLHIRPPARSLRYFSSSLISAATAAKPNVHPEWVQHAEAVTEREQQWKQYRRARNWRRVRNLIFTSFGFAMAYSLFYHPNEESVLQSLKTDQRIRRILHAAAAESPENRLTELQSDRKGPLSLTGDTLRDVKLLGPKKAFWSHSQKELLQFQWFGILLSGWPTVVHGGAIATSLSEAMSTAAACIENRAEPFPEPSSFSLTYLKPTTVRSFYLIRVRPLDLSTSQPAGPSLPPSSSNLGQEGRDIGPSKDLTKQPLPSEPPANDDEYLQLEATLETLDGKVLVKARASFTKT